jgi:hypothetical protein
MNTARLQIPTYALILLVLDNFRAQTPVQFRSHRGPERVVLPRARPPRSVKLELRRLACLRVAALVTQTIGCIAHTHGLPDGSAAAISAHFAISQRSAAAILIPKAIRITRKPEVRRRTIRRARHAMGAALSARQQTANHKDTLPVGSPALASPYQPCNAPRCHQPSLRYRN